jgi:hypothetical protein
MTANPIDEPLMKTMAGTTSDLLEVLQLKGVEKKTLESNAESSYS